MREGPQGSPTAREADPQLHPCAPAGSHGQPARPPFHLPAQAGLSDCGWGGQNHCLVLASKAINFTNREAVSSTAGSFPPCPQRCWDTRDCAGRCDGGKCKCLLTGGSQSFSERTKMYRW